MDRGTSVIVLLLVATTIAFIIFAARDLVSATRTGGLGAPNSLAPQCTYKRVHSCRDFGPLQPRVFHEAALAAGWPCEHQRNLCGQNYYIPRDLGCPNSTWDYLYEHGYVYGSCYLPCPAGCERVMHQPCTCGPPQSRLHGLAASQHSVRDSDVLG